MVIFSFPKIISSATRPPIATSSLARSWDFDQLSSSFSGNWATFKRKCVYIPSVSQFGFSSAVFHAKSSVSVKHIRSTKSLAAWERDELEMRHGGYETDGIISMLLFWEYIPSLRLIHEVQWLLCELARLLGYTRQPVHVLLHGRLPILCS